MLLCVALLSALGYRSVCVRVCACLRCVVSVGGIDIIPILILILIPIVIPVIILIIIITRKGPTQLNLTQGEGRGVLLKISILCVSHTIL